jgi:hypothetical protein
VIPGKPAHTEYYPTEKGTAVQRILVEIASFSAKYEPEIIFVDKRPRNNGYVRGGSTPTLTRDTKQTKLEDFGIFVEDFSIPR